MKAKNRLDAGDKRIYSYFCGLNVARPTVAQ